MTRMHLEHNADLKWLKYQKQCLFYCNVFVDKILNKPVNETKKKSVHKNNSFVIYSCHLAKFVLSVWFKQWVKVCGRNDYTLCASQI